MMCDFWRLAESCQQDSTAAASPSGRPPTVLRTRSATRTPGTAPQLPTGLRKHPTPPHSKGLFGSTAAAAGASGGNIGAVAAAASLGMELPSVLRHVNFSSASSAYTPSQLLEVRRRGRRAGSRCSAMPCAWYAAAAAAAELLLHMYVKLTCVVLSCCVLAAMQKLILR